MYLEISARPTGKTFKMIEKLYSLSQFPSVKQIQYFATTPARLRSPEEFQNIKEGNDLLLKAFMKNNWQYETKVNSRLITDISFQKLPITEKFGALIKEKEDNGRK